MLVEYMDYGIRLDLLNRRPKLPPPRTAGTASSANDMGHHLRGCFFCGDKNLHKRDYCKSCYESFVK